MLLILILFLILAGGGGSWHTYNTYGAPYGLGTLVVVILLVWLLARGRL